MWFIRNSLSFLIDILKLLFCKENSKHQTVSWKYYLRDVGNLEYDLEGLFLFLNFQSYLVEI